MSSSSISGIILAGGESKRMNHDDKGLILYQQQPLIAHVVSAIKPQVDDIVISANRNIEQYQQFSSTVIPDNTEMHGPLSGIAAALPVCSHELVLVVACDMPFLPSNLVSTLAARLDDKDVAIAETEHRLQLVFLMRKSLLPSVQQALSSGHYQLMRWAQSQPISIIDFSSAAASFRNINSIQDLQSA